MSKTPMIFLCSSCDAQFPKWSGRCLECGAWGSLAQGVAKKNDRPSPVSAAATATPLEEIESGSTPRITTGIGEVDQVLGGGIVPGSLILLGGEPGIGKCVTANTRILDPSSGAFLPITAWKDNKLTVVSLNQHTHRLTRSTVAAFHDQGCKPIVEVITRMGKSLRCTSNHPLLTPDGWKQLKDMKRGDRIASPRSLPFFGNHFLEDHKIKCIAYLLSDGSAGKNFSVTAAIPEIWDDLKSIAKKFNVSITAYQKKNTKAKMFKFTQPWKKKKIAREHFARNLQDLQRKINISWAEWSRRAHVSQSMIYLWCRGKTVPSEYQLQQMADAVEMPIEKFLPSLRDTAESLPVIMRFIESVGLRFLRAQEKAVPQCIFLLPRHKLSLFLKTLFSCDGSIYVNQHSQAGISYCTISKTLAQDIHHLLLRFGFTAKLRTKHSIVNNGPYIAYELQILGTREVKRFVEEIGIHGRHKAKKQLRSLSIPTIPSTHRDTIPTGLSFWKSLEEITDGISYKELSRRCGMTIHTSREERPLTRSVVTALALAYPSSYLEKIDFNDIYWDEINEIIPAGHEVVYDITVPSNENFIANDLIIHNSTLLAQIGLSLSGQNKPILYCSGEESGHQVKLRYDRLKRNGSSVGSILFTGDTDCDAVCAKIAADKPLLAIVDSIQTMSTSQVESEAGSVTQVRACTVKCLETAKRHDVPIIITGHVTKEGMVAGPKTLEHLVDTVLYLEGDGNHYFRILRTVKNRFGSTNEIGVFEMSGSGLLEISNPSQLFIDSGSSHAPGSATVAVIEGSRPFLVQVQSLTSKTYFGYPQRRAVGFDVNRLQLLIAVLAKRVGLNLGDQDVHVNIAGGMKISEPALDLAVCASIMSAYANKPFPSHAVFFGEVGLSGEIRPVSGTDKRLKEAEKLGFTVAYLPSQKTPSSNVQLMKLKHIQELEL